MTKEQFCKCMGIIKKRYDACDVILDMLYEFFGVTDKIYGVLNVQSEIEILATAMGDKNEWIEYYIYECNWGSVDNDVRIDGKSVSLKTY